MKLYLKSYFYIITTLLVCTFFISLILTLLHSNNILNYKISNIITISTSYITYALLSFILGIKIKKHGLLNGLILVILITLLSLVLKIDLTNFTNIIDLVAKSLIIMFFTILGVNKKGS